MVIGLAGGVQRFDTDVDRISNLRLEAKARVAGAAAAGDGALGEFAPNVPQAAAPAAAGDGALGEFAQNFPQAAAPTAAGDGALGEFAQNFPQAGVQPGVRPGVQPDVQPLAAGTRKTGQDADGGGLLREFGQQFAAGFKENPIAAIGVMLAGIGGNTGAIKAYQGMRGQQAARERLRLDTADLLRIATKDGLDMLELIPEKDREEAAMQFCMQYEQFSAGFCDFFDMMARRTDGREMARAASENWPLIYEMTGGNPDQIQKVLANKDLMAMINERADGYRRPGIAYRLGLITAELERNPEADALIPRTASGQFRFTFPQLERLNRALPKEIQFTAGDFGTMRRNEDLLIDAGFAPPSVLEDFAAALATEAGKIEASRDQFYTYFNNKGLFVQEDKTTGEVTVLDTPTDLEDFFRIEDEQRGEIVDLNREILAAMREDGEVPSQVRTDLENAEQRLENVGAAIASKGDSSEYQRLIDEGNRINAALAADPTAVEKVTLEDNLKDNRDRIEFLTTKVGRTEFDAAGRAFEISLARSAAKAVDRLTTLVRERGETVGLMHRLFNLRSEEDEEIRAKELVGIQGWIRRRIGGVLQQLHPELAEVINAVLGGKATPQQVQAFNTAAEGLVTQQISVIAAGDELGRYTDIEREITRLAVAATSVTASAEQVQAAFSEVWMLQTLMRQEELVRAGRPLDYNLTSEGIDAMAAEFKANGLDLGQSEIMLNRLVNTIPGWEAEAAYRRSLREERE